MRILLFLLVIAAGSNVYAQKMKEADVPAPAVSALHKMYPSIKNYVWYSENGNYEAEYKDGKMEAAVTFDKNGNLVETEKQIAVSSLPAGISSYVSSHYSGATIHEASQITDASGVKKYEAEIRGRDVIFDAEGKFLGEEKE